MSRSSTIADFCDRHDLSESTVYRLIRSGQLRVVKIGRSTRIPDENERAFLASLQTPSAQTTRAA